MTFTPTKEQLEELGFSKGDGGFWILKIGGIILTYSSFFHVHFTTFHPSSLEDLKTLIRILAPKE